MQPVFVSNPSHFTVNTGLIECPKEECGGLMHVSMDECGDCMNEDSFFMVGNQRSFALSRRNFINRY